jgi:hypothetical protein
MKLANAFWSVFEKTGSVLAYLLYRYYLSASHTNDVEAVEVQ